jgi:hypothetical protein
VSHLNDQVSQKLLSNSENMCNTTTQAQAQALT